MSNVRDAKPPAQERPIAGVIEINHGALQRPILRLAVYQRDDQIAPGLPFQLVKDACRIISNNRDGELERWEFEDSVAVERTCTPVVLPPENLLGPGDYIYRVAGDDPNYPVCISFASWKPPRLPPIHWKQVDGVGTTTANKEGNASEASDIVKLLDANCAVTGATDRLHVSHLVPKEEESWWIENMMYNTAGFDDAHFFLYPYQAKWVTLFACNGSPDLAFDHDFRAARIPRRIHPMFLYSRFAWNLFKLATEDLLLLANEPMCISLERKAVGLGGWAFSGSNNKRKAEEVSGTASERSENTSGRRRARINAWQALEQEMIRNGIDQMGEIYVGMSETWRVAENYRQNNPAVSAVGGTDFALVGDDDDEQDLTGVWPPDQFTDVDVLGK
ncbi:hypothetical protein B0H19DRAFT_1267590 [Mycena capillaripes]|nr:hypothetical protein B0H19DRAFT_1267590 [Mycena capillaripes]